MSWPDHNWVGKLAGPGMLSAPSVIVDHMKVWTADELMALTPA